MSEISTPGAGAARWNNHSGPKRFALCLCLVALLQSAVLAWMIYDRVSLINTGKEIVLDIVPVDPRSLFRGDYVILNYGISRINLQALEGDGDFKRGMTVFVTLQKPDDAAWRPASIAKNYPAKVSEGQIVIRGKAGSAGTNLQVKYGIESYFVPEGRGKTLEQQVRDRKLQVLVAVGTNGEAAIKGLLVDGKLQYEEALF